jgi:hypothetical protein
MHTLALGLLLALASGRMTVGLLAARPSPGGGSASATGVVRGVVWNADNSPLPNGKVRLRDVLTGRVEGQAVTTDRGEFVFDKVHGATYVSEVVDEAGKVIAVGQSFQLDSGATVATFVRLPPRQSWLAGAFSNTAAAVIAAASSAGVTAMGTKAPPVSPQ